MSAQKEDSKVAEKTRKYIVQGGFIKHNGKMYGAGDEIELTEEEAQVLKSYLKEAAEKKK